MLNLRVVADLRAGNSEGPLWHPEERRLYWTDIPSGHLHVHDPADGTHDRIYEGPQVGGMTLQADGSLLLFRERGNVARFQDGAIVDVIEGIEDERETRFNDVIADPEGRVFCGTMPTRDRKGRLYRLDPDGSIRVVVEDVGCSNGMGFTPDGTGLYFIDSPTLRVDLFDYDRATGELSNRRPFVHTPRDRGVPDGMTVDANGYVWVAFWDGRSLARYSPEGEEVLRLEFPVKKVSCLTFGGEDYGDIYATTAGGDRTDENGPLAGSVFHFRFDGVRGVPEFRSKVRLS